jgi:hypothetical protein
MTALAIRDIRPELLDTLLVDDPLAIGSRRDLMRVNAVMFQGAIMAGLMRANLPATHLRILEIGAGDGRFMLSVARRLGWRDVELTLLDQADLVTRERREQFQALGWQVETITADIFDWIDKQPNHGFDGITANLFLHHFDAEQLRRLLSAMANIAPMFLATEPHRNTFALWSTGWLRALGANAVTLHDAAASVRAGFADHDLSDLWPQGSAETLQERRVGPFTHTFVARKAPPTP